MSTTPVSAATDQADLLRAVRFAREQFANWRQQGLLSAPAGQTLDAFYAEKAARLEAGHDANVARLRPPTACWDCKNPIGPRQDYCLECGAPVQGDNVTRLRYLTFTCHEVQNHARAGRLPLAVSHDMLAEGNARIVALRKTLDQGRALTPEVVEEVPVPARRERPRISSVEPSAPKEPPRPLIEVLLDPRNIQWLLAIGGVLLVLGLVIYLAASGFFENPRNAAVVMGAGNALLLAGGWATVFRTRYQMAGRALTLLACLAMPLNLWFYHTQNLITVEGGGLWIPALVICVLYAVSARVLKDPAFVYALVGGVVLTGLLILADRNPDRFWQISIPSTMLVVLGVLCIHLERAFPPEEGPFSRQRFGLAFFWSGHLSLASGLLLLLGAQLAGGPLYPFFQSWYEQWNAVPSPVVTETGGKLLALALVLLGTYAYVYSDVVVRRIGLYLSLAVGTLLWAELLLISLVSWPMEPMEVAILGLAVTGLVVNLALSSAGGSGERMTRSAAPLALALSVLPVLLGVYLYFLAVPGKTMSGYRLTWTYVGAMAGAAMACRVGAYLRRGQRWLETVYLFGTGASLLVGLVGVLMAVNPDLEWHQRAPVVMLLPIAYLAAARLSRGTTRERALTWVAHTGTLVMLISSTYTALHGFAEVRQHPLNLYLAVFFAEAALFYLLEAAFRTEGEPAVEGAGVYGAAVMAAAAVWQVLAYFDVSAQVYILGFAAVGLALLVCYRFTVLEGFGSSQLSSGAFWAGSALLLLGSAAGALRTLADMAGDRFVPGELGRAVLLPAVLALFSLAAVVLVRERNWRRIYVVSAIAQAGLTVLTLAVLGNLTPAQKTEIVAVVLGLLLLVSGHVGLLRERERHDDLVSFSLGLGCLLAGVPLTVATLSCRLSSPPPFDNFHVINEMTMLAVGLLLLATGYVFQIKSTTLTGVILSVTWVLTLVLYARLPERLQTTAIYLMIGGGVFFGTGLLLSVYRDRLLTLPDRFKRREGVFRVLTWR